MNPVPPAPAASGPRRARRACALAGAFLLAGCAAQSPETFLANVDLGLFTEPEPPPEKRAWAAETEEARRWGKPIDLEVQDADLREVLNGLAKDHGLDLLIAEGVGGKVTARLRRRPVIDAIGNLARLTGNAAHLIGGAVHVKNPRKGAEAASATFSPRHRKVETLAPFAIEILGGEGLVAIDPRANLMTLRGPETRLDELLALLSRIDAEPDLQVQIEAKFVEVRKDLLTRIGVRWGEDALNPGIILSSPEGGEIRTGFDPTAEAPDRPGAEIEIHASDPGGVTFGTFKHLRITDLDLFLDAFERQNLLRVINSPRVVALDRQPARIEVDNVIRFVAEVRQEVTSPTDNPIVAVKTEELRLGASLEITPILHRAGLIELSLKPKVTELVEWTNFNVGDSTVRLPTTRTRQLAATVQVEDGTTLILGGLVSNRRSLLERGIPGLMDLPVLDVLFESREPAYQEYELVVFLTARLVRDARSVSTRQEERRVWDGLKPPEGEKEKP